MVTFANVAQGENLPVEFVFSGLRAAAGVLILLRLGLLALAVAALFFHLLIRLPVYARLLGLVCGRSIAVLLALAALTVYGFRTGLAGGRSFSAARLED